MWCTHRLSLPVGGRCLSLPGKIRHWALAQRVATAAVGDHIHLLTLRARTLHVRKAEAGTVTTAQANVAILRPAEHAPELAAQNTIRTAYDRIGHLLRTLLPLFDTAHRNSAVAEISGGSTGRSKSTACALNVSH